MSGEDVDHAPGEIGGRQDLGQLQGGEGWAPQATTTTAFPVVITGAITLTSPRSEEVWGASTPTTPVGSGNEKLK